MLKTLNNILYRQHRAVIYFNDSLQIVHCNELARNFLEKNKCLSVTDSNLTCRDPNDQESFKTALIAARDSVLSAIVFIKRSSSQIPCRLDVTPILDTTSDFDQAKPTIMIIIEDLSFSKQLLVDKLQSYYNLTDAESGLIELLVRNKTLKECAELKDVKISTIRWTLGNVFSKTGTSSQKDLINLSQLFLD